MIFFLSGSMYLSFYPAKKVQAFGYRLGHFQWLFRIIAGTTDGFHQTGFHIGVPHFRVQLKSPRYG